MLKDRIITALILLPLVILALFLPNILFDILIGLILLLAGWEYTQLINITARAHQLAYIGGLAGLYVIGLFFPLPFLFIGLIWWAVASVFITKFPLGQTQWAALPWLRASVGYLLMIPAFIGLAVLHSLPEGWAWVLLVLLIVWSADIGAYFAGRLFGKQPLAPLVSPKKTVQGLYGGLVAVMIVTIIYLFVWHFSLFSEPFFFVLVLLVFLLSVMGDLVESGIKRWMNVKDSGSILPGHGGLLDRIDSLLAAAPAFALGVILLVR